VNEEERLREALRHIMWIKDCGIDGRVDGSWMNFAAQERDEMYKIAKLALMPQTLLAPHSALTEEK
jgi:hypothetical protein